MNYLNPSEYIPDAKPGDIKNGMIWVPPGPFLMGVSSSETDTDPHYPDIDYLADSRPQRVVDLSGYWIDKEPVTFIQYAQFVEITGYVAPSWPSYTGESLQKYAWNGDDYPNEFCNCPVVLVTWYDAYAYAEWAGKTLPTEAQWEKAARGVDGRCYPWGNAIKNPFPANCSHNDDTILELTSTNAFPEGASPYGCLDMLGNVYEWCIDWYWQYNEMPINNNNRPYTRPSVPDKVIRGCGRFDSSCHIAKRSFSRPWTRDKGTGFRCVWIPTMD